MELYVRKLDWVDEETIALELGVSVKTLRKWRTLRQGPPYSKFGSLVRYSLSEVREWAKAQRQGHNHRRRKREATCQ